MKILVADDDSISRRLMQHTLQRFGYQVVLAENGRRAAEILSGVEGPRLALVDWMMPELDGPGLCREVRHLHRDGAYIYILLLTSKQSRDNIVAGLEAGADDYITKPCQPAELRARLNTGRRILSLEEKLVRAREEMRFKATHDALTAIWNRGTILSLAARELARSARENKPTSILLCDIDHFKLVNDNYGHLVGDSILQEVAKRLAASVRPYDAVGRYGGEEFLIVLRDCDSSSLAFRCDEVRHGISESPFVTDGCRLSISISIGAVTCPPRDQDTSIERALSWADAALYKAKTGGRNRTVLADALTAV
jgi:diguanylate cyclase (GGDEF)-like protein